ncbi:pentapeptide repeat-containing protein [Limosilactobacillus fermentum]|nr:hypothetical protein [Limosilactobacillus fermentum]MCT3427923.1 hypothetical protein [Limosilactobacillus fermentum]
MLPNVNLFIIPHLRHANLRHANLRHANLIDFSCAV